MQIEIFNCSTSIITRVTEKLMEKFTLLMSPLTLNFKKLKTIKFLK